MKFFPAAFFVFLFLLTLPVSAHELRTHQIEMSENGYIPQNLTITQNDKVVFKNVSQKNLWPASNIHPTHDIYPEFDAKRTVRPGESWEFQFEKAGEWKYHDHLFPQTTGTITVEADDHPQTVTPTKTPVKPFQNQGLFERFKKFWNNLRQFLWKKIQKNRVDSQSHQYKGGAKEIFYDDNQLRSYIKAFGSKKTIEKLYELESTLGDCHQRAHKTGRFTYEMLGEQAFKQHGSQCHSGYFHGVIEAFFKKKGTANLTNSLKLICKNESNGFFSHQCFHGIGHGLMAWSSYELYDALQTCDRLPRGLESCYTGVFMENVVGGLAEDEGTGHITKYLNEDPQYPCDAVLEQYKSACYIFQTSRMRELFDFDFRKIAQACLQAPEIYQPICFSSMGRDASGIHQEDVASAIKECQFAPYGDYRTSCLAGAVQDRLWDPSGQAIAISFCQFLSDTEEKAACYETIILRAGELLSSNQDRQGFCQKIESDYQKSCMQTLTRL